MGALFDHQRDAAAEYLRAFGPIGASLHSCLLNARARAVTKEEHERCRVAADLLGLD